MPTTEPLSPQGGILADLSRLVEHTPAEQLPGLLDELAAVLRRGRAVVRRAARKAQPAEPVPPAPVPPAPPAPDSAAAPTSVPAPAPQPAPGRPASGSVVPQPAPAGERTSRVVIAAVTAAAAVLAVLVMTLALAGPGFAGDGHSWLSWLAGAGVGCLPGRLLAAGVGW
ncbi:MAG: hypothetical protein ABR559_03225 [Gemmatimonadota bacterium]